MNKEPHRFEIVKTPCWPCEWKCKSINYMDDNSTHRYHRTIEEAEKWIKKQNGVLVKIRRENLNLTNIY